MVVPGSAGVPAMANADHLDLLRHGVDAWNAWRAKNLSVKPDLLSADLSGTDLAEADLRWALLNGANLSNANLAGAMLVGADLYEANLAKANLSKADLRTAHLFGADLSEADLREARLKWARLFRARLYRADLTGADLTEADLCEAALSEANLCVANLSDANLCMANLREADLGEANLRGARLVGTDFASADLTGCRIYGISAWGLKLDEKTMQRDLVITTEDEPVVTVDNIEVAQFIYLLLHNEKIREVIDTVTTKAVLILGRFSLPERKAVLDALRDELRKRDLLPVIFDFSIPASRDVTETVKVLAGLARFVIADITDATEVRVELHNIVPDFTKLPVQPILLRGLGEFVSLPGHLKSYPWVLPTFEYEGLEHLLANLDEVIRPAEAKSLELRGTKLV